MTELVLVSNPGCLHGLLASLTVGPAPAAGCVQDVDYRLGRVSGSMRALDVAGAPGPIDTFFEGHIIDDMNNT